MATKNVETSSVDQDQELASGAEATRNVSTFAPATDIKEGKDGIFVELDMPSVKPDTIDVTFERNVLTVSAQGRSTSPSGYALTYAEYRDGDYERSFRVSEAVNSSKIDATYSDGVLHLFLPHSKQAAPKKIKVKTKR